MKKRLMFMFFCFSGLCLNAQKTEDEYKEIYNKYQWSASDFVNTLDTMIIRGDFKFVKRLKNFDIKSIKATILNMGVDAVRQMNIDGWYYCSVKHEDCFKLWNLYYPRLNRTIFDSYCKGLVYLMILDQTLIVN